MFCPKCGAQVEDGADFCGSCGAPITKRAQGAPSAAPSAAGVYAKKKKGRGPLVVVLAAVAVVALAVGLLFGLGVVKLPGGPVYVMVSQTSYDSDGKVTSSYEYELDEHGNAVHVTYKNSSNSSNSYEEERTYDRYGYVTSVVREKKSGGTDEKEYEYKYDEHNRATSRHGDDGVTVKYTYHDNGVLKTSQTIQQGVTQTSTFDEQGFQQSLKIQFDSGSATLIEYEWELDSKGNPVSCTMTGKTRSSDNSRWEESSSMNTHTYELDEHGNIVKVYDKDGNLISECEYVKVNNPSDNARATAQRTLNR